MGVYTHSFDGMFLFNDSMYLWQILVPHFVVENVVTWDTAKNDEALPLIYIMSPVVLVTMSRYLLRPIYNINLEGITYMMHPDCVCSINIIIHDYS